MAEVVIVTPKGWTSFQISIAILLVVTGSLNTLAAKWADTMEAKGRKFDHPFLQAVFMFIGEFLCLPAFFIHYAIQKWRHKNNSQTHAELGRVDAVDADGNVISSEPKMPKFNPLIMLPPAVFDMCATSIMYVGLNMTNAASFQMLRGSVIIFTGLLSMCVLRVRMPSFRWIGMAGVFAGLVVVGLSDILFGEKKASADASNEILGDALIVVSQLIVACQMVYEQKYLMKYDVPALLAVGLEGLFGGVFLAILLVPMYYIKVSETFSKNPFGRLEDVPLAMEQMAENPMIIVALCGTAFSVAFFNFAGISVTKELSATTRMVLDSVRTLVIWAVSLALMWQQFVSLQILGFTFLIVGMFVYNDILFGPWCRKHIACCRPTEDADERVAIINEDAHNQSD